MSSENIVLVGFMGVGKSVVAGRLGAKLGRKVVDTDEAIGLKRGLSIAEIFARFGEAEFRKMERECALELAKQKNLVIATGGGFYAALKSQKSNSVCANEGVQLGRVVWLRASFEEILSHLCEADGSFGNASRAFEEASFLQSPAVQKRPLFKDIDSARRLFNARQEGYKAVCNFAVDVGGKNANEVASLIISLLK